MDDLVFARALMGSSFVFHIVYTAIGIGLPLMLLIAEGLSLFRKQEVYHEMARRWIRTAGVLFAIGAVSGTILSFELGMLWPRFMGFAGGLIGLPFAMEGFAFFTEAIFLGLYLYGERRLSRRAQLWVTVPMIIAAALSAVFVISANGWMQTPAGFTMKGGQVTNVNPFAAMANPAWPHEALHGTLSSFAATSVAMVGLYGLALLRGRKTDYNRRALNFSLLVAAFAVPAMFLSGDFAARQVAHLEQAKFAAMEGIFKTMNGAPIHIGGWPDPATQTVRFGIAIPKLLSFLGYGDPNATVKGLNEFPANARPDPRPVHIFFDLMVGSFFIMLLPLLWAALTLLRKKRLEDSRWLARLSVLAGPFGFIALESGWFVTEFGRQPWIAHNLMTLSQGVTPRGGLLWIFLIFLVVYLALTAGLIWLLLNPFPARTGNPSKQAVRHDG